jgi:hypothetical protein
MTLALVYNAKRLIDLNKKTNPKPLNTCAAKP